MARIKMGDFRPTTAGNFKKLSLEKGEQARVVYLEEEPTVAYIHSFEKVKTGPDGKAIIKVDQWPDGTPREEYETTYAGKMRCLGDTEVLMDTGADPEACPACKAAVENSSAVRRPTARYLGHVFHYNTRQGTASVSKPFSGTVKVWDLTSKRFELLHSIFLEHGDLRRKDLILGPCDNKQMQKYDIQVGKGDAVWTSDEAYQTYLLEAYEEGKVDDLEAVAAQRKSPAEMQSLVNEIVRAFNHATGAGTSTYESLLGSDNSTTGKKKTSKPDEDDADETIDEETGEVFDSQSVVEDDDDDVAPAASSDSTLSLNDLLSSIGKKN